MAATGPQNLLSSFEPVERRTVSAEVRERLLDAVRSATLLDDPAKEVSPQAIEAALDSANRAIMEHQETESRLANMRATAVVLAVDAITRATPASDVFVPF